MSIAATLPPLDPVGLSAAPGWFVFLLLLTMLLHVVFMNFVLGGSVLAVGLNLASLLGRSGANATANLIYQVMPVALSMAITMGVAPLLFVQVLYGQAFYASTVLMGLVWFSLVVAVLAGFYLLYWLTFRGSNALQGRTGAWDQRPGRRLAVGLAATLCLLWVAWVLTNNHVLSIQPELWERGPSWAGPRFLARSAMTLPRYLHNLVGATAIAGLWIAGMGWWRRWRTGQQSEHQAGMIRFGLMAAAVATAAQIPVGIMLLFTLRGEVIADLIAFKTGFGVVWTIALIPAVLLPFVLWLAAMQPGQSRLSALGVGLAVVVLAGMVIGREQVRLSYLGQTASFSLADAPVYPQYGVMGVFLVLLVAGLATVGLMLWWMLAAGRGAAADTGGGPVQAPTMLNDPADSAGQRGAPAE